MIQILKPRRWKLPVGVGSPEGGVLGPALWPAVLPVTLPFATAPQRSKKRRKLKPRLLGSQSFIVRCLEVFEIPGEPVAAAYCQRWGPAGWPVMFSTLTRMHILFEEQLVYIPCRCPLLGFTLTLQSLDNILYSVNISVSRHCAGCQGGARFGERAGFRVSQPRAMSSGSWSQQWFPVVAAPRVTWGAFKIPSAFIQWLFHLRSIGSKNCKRSTHGKLVYKPPIPTMRNSGLCERTLVRRLQSLWVWSWDDWGAWKQMEATCL